MTTQKQYDSIDKWLIEVELILASKNISGLTENKEIRKIWSILYNQKYSPIQAYNHIVLGIID